MNQLYLLILLFFMTCQPPMASADFGQAGGGVRNIYVYGDSFVDWEEIWTAYLFDHGIERTQFYTAANGGARSFYYNGADDDCDSTNGYGDECAGYIIRQVLYESGSCRVDYDFAGHGNNDDGKSGPTCIADRDIGPNDICVLNTGTNDANYGQPAGWQGAADVEGAAQSATLLILDEFDRVGCPTVVSSSVPLIRGSSTGLQDTGAFWRLDGALDKDDNALLFANWLKAEVEDNRPNMVFVDLRQIFNDFQVRHGEAAFLELYDCEGGRGSQYVSSGATPEQCGDGVHPHYAAGSLGVSGRGLQAQAQGQAILQLRDLVRDNPVWIGN